MFTAHSGQIHACAAPWQSAGGITAHPAFVARLQGAADSPADATAPTSQSDFQPGPNSEAQFEDWDTDAQSPEADEAASSPSSVLDQQHSADSTSASRSKAPGSIASTYWRPERADRNANLSVIDERCVVTCQGLGGCSQGSQHVCRHTQHHDLLCLTCCGASDA